MSRETCRSPSCERPIGAQDREDYHARLFCSIRCQVRYEYLRADADDAFNAALACIERSQVPLNDT